MGVQPLLMKFAVSRSEALDIPGRYDSDRSVWVIDADQGAVPIVQAKGDEGKLAELSTKTDSVPERDDARMSALVELTTKTSHQLERDDVDPRGIFLELVTVTKISREQTDLY